MRIMPAFFLTLAFLLPLTLCGQPKQFPDSIRIELADQGAFVIFEMRRYGDDKQMMREFPSILTSLVEQIKKSIPERAWSEPHRVEVDLERKDGSMASARIKVVEPGEKTTHIKMGQDAVLELLPPGWDVKIRHEKGVVWVYAPELNTLEETGHVSLEPAIALLNVDPEFERSKRMGVISRIVLKDGSATRAGSTSHRLPADMLGLHAGAGAGIAGDRLYPEANFMAAVYFANRYRQNFQRIGVTYELKVFSGRTEERAFRSMPASFLSLSYALNFAADRPRWTGIGVGYMVHNRSDLFRGKTMKLFIESDIGSSKLNIIPELYLTDDFKRSIFGIKLNYKF